MQISLRKSSIEWLLGRSSLKILGIDPGLRVLGYGLIESQGNQIKYLNCGTLELPNKITGPDRFAWFDKALRELFSQFQPQHVALEKIFLGKNVDSAFKLGHVRGVCLAVAKTFDAEIHEYAARSVKKGVAGNGGAEKEQVRFMLRALLKIQAMPALDASDALALAYFHVQSIQISMKLKKQNKEVSL